MLNRPIRVVLVRPRNPVNIGACARALANFGFSDLVVVDPYEPIWRETRSAPGAENVVKEARAVATWDEAVADCAVVLGTSSFHQRPLPQSVIELPNLNRYLSAYSASDPLAVIFGSERSGLSNEELARCQAIVRIPTHRNMPSMNLGQAAAVVLYEIRRGGWEAPAPVVPAPAQELEQLLCHLSALGASVNYPSGHEDATRLGRFRQAFQDAVLPPSTVRFLLSYTRWLQKKLAR